jgi:hypothetical protein
MKDEELILAGLALVALPKLMEQAGALFNSVFSSAFPMDPTLSSPGVIAPSIEAQMKAEKMEDYEKQKPLPSNIAVQEVIPENSIPLATAEELLKAAYVSGVAETPIAPETTPITLDDPLPLTWGGMQPTIEVENVQSVSYGPGQPSATITSAPQYGDNPVVNIAVEKALREGKFYTKYVPIPGEGALATPASDYYREKTSEGVQYATEQYDMFKTKLDAALQNPNYSAQGIADLRRLVNQFGYQAGIL